MSYAQITLTPLQPFFFGGEHSFQDASGYDRYYARSEYFAHQTQLLGMLRQTIMFNEEILKAYVRGDFVPKEKQKIARQTVGGRWSIDANSPDLGKIVSISPLCITDGVRLLMRAPLDTGLQLRTISGKAYYNGNEKAPQTLYASTCKPFDAKDGLFEGLLGSDGTKMSYDEVYLPVEQPGNQKLYPGGTKQNAFYKKRSYLFRKKNFSFTFFIEHGGLRPIQDTVVTLGADRSKFKLRMHTLSEPPQIEAMFTRAIEPSVLHKVVLLSDALVTQEMLEACDFYLGALHPIKYNEQEKNGKKISFKKSKPYTMLAKGSVLYFTNRKDAITVQQTLKNNEALHKIGYNRTVHIPAKEETDV
jgi:CRISPR-associated protein Cmr3